MAAPAAVAAAASFNRRSCEEGKGKWSTPAAGFLDGNVSEILEALGDPVGKENAGVCKKRRPKMSLSGLVELSPPACKLPVQRKVLESRAVNVVVENEPLDPGRGVKLPSESRRPKKAVDTCRNSSSGRPPWENETGISTNNRHVAAIAERVRLNLSRTGPKPGQPALLSSKPGGTDAPATGKVKRRASLLRSGRTIKVDAASALASPQPPSFHLDMDLARTFCVDVRVDPNKPWRLAPKMPNTSRPLVMFPNPAFRAYTEDMGNQQEQVVSPKLTPFKSFQLKPLKLDFIHGHVQQPQLLSRHSPATVGPYLCPSKTSPQQSLQPEEKEVSTAHGSRDPPGPPSCATSRSFSSMQSWRENCVPMKIDSWLSKHLSLPCSASSTSLIRRFSLVNNKHAKNCAHSPAKPLPSLITRLPMRNKHTPIHSLLVTPPPWQWKPLGLSEGSKMAVSPLPLPPALQALPSRTHKLLHRRSSSCQLYLPNAKESAHINDKRELSIHRSFSSREVRESMEPSRKKSAWSDFAGYVGSSNSSSMKRSSPSYRHGCMTNCTGAGPCLVKHVKGWSHTHKPVMV